MGSRISHPENDLKDIALQVGLQIEQVERLYERFKSLDRQNNGILTAQEFKYIPELVMNPFNRMPDEVDFPTFCKLISPFSQQASREDKLRYAFSMYNSSQSGRISRDELIVSTKLMVGENLEMSQINLMVDEIFSTFDSDGDGFLSFSEFKHALQDCKVETKMTIQI